MKKMMTGGMKNPNAAVQRQTTPGSKGVTPGVNTAAQRQTTPGSRGVEVRKNAPAVVSPSKPASKMYGGKMKKGGAKKK